MFGMEKHQGEPPVKGKAELATLKPRLGMTVTDPHPTVTTVAAFERKALNGTAFKFTASEATILNIKSFKGYTAQADRTDGARPRQMMLSRPHIAAATASASLQSWLGNASQVPRWRAECARRRRSRASKR